MGAYVNGCRSQEECEETRCCIKDWIPGVETDIGLCVKPSTSGSICSPSCPRPSCIEGLKCVVDDSDPNRKVHICQWRSSFQGPKTHGKNLQASIHGSNQLEKKKSFPH